MTKEFVSIIMPVKNVENYIKQCIDSVLNQTHREFEFIIVDDSADNTSKIIDSYNDRRIKHIIYKGNISQALNYGINSSNYDIVCRMDGDDYCTEDRIECQLNYLLTNKDKVDILGCNIVFLNSVNKEIMRKKYPEYNDEINFYMPIFTSLPHPTLMTYKSTLASVNYYDETQVVEDLDLFLRLINKGCKFHNLQEYLYFYRYRKEIDFINQKNSEVNSHSYSLGKNYLSLYSKADNNLKNLRHALLEYYRGSMKNSRKYFHLYFKSNPAGFFRYFRYYSLSCLPQKLISGLRFLGIPQKINHFLLKCFKIEMLFLPLNREINNNNKAKTN